jgi:hypothetical protein
MKLKSIFAIVLALAIFGTSCKKEKIIEANDLPLKSQPLVYKGITHTPLGNSTLTLLNNGAKLLVENFGTTGNDGVQIDITGKCQWDADFEPLQLPFNGSKLYKRLLDDNGIVRAEYLQEKTENQQYQISINSHYIDGDITLRGFRNGIEIFNETIVNPYNKKPWILIPLALWIGYNSDGHIKVNYDSNGFSGSAGYTWKGGAIIHTTGGGVYEDIDWLSIETSNSAGSLNPITTIQYTGILIDKIEFTDQIVNSCN